MNDLWRSVCTVCAMTMVAVSAALASGDPYSQSIADHKTWIQGCTASQIAVRHETLVLYSIERASGDDNLVKCLLSDLDVTPVSSTTVMYPSPFDSSEFGDGPPRRMLEVMIQTRKMVLVVSGVESDHGVIGVTPVGGNTVMVKTSNATHDRNYLVNGDTGEVGYISDGDVTVSHDDGASYLAKGRKSYFREGGTFWYDALIDHEGRILDIVVPTENFDSEGIVCMSREEFDRRTNINVESVPAHEICIRW